MTMFTDVPLNGYKAGDIWHWQDLDGLEIGGRNYAKNSRKTLELSNVTNNRTQMNGDIPYNLASLAGKAVTISVEVEAKNPQPQNPTASLRMGCEMAIPLSSGVTHYLGIWKILTVGVDVPKRRISRAVFVPADIQPEQAQGLHLYVQANGDYFRVSNPKIEIGYKATDWSPAPEDLLPTGATEGYFIAGRDSESFDFNDWAYYSQPIQNFSKLLWFAESVEI